MVQFYSTANAEDFNPLPVAACGHAAVHLSDCCSYPSMTGYVHSALWAPCRLLWSR